MAWVMATMGTKTLIMNKHWGINEEQLNAVTKQKSSNSTQFTNLPHQEIRRNYGILCSKWNFITILKVVRQIVISLLNQRKKKCALHSELERTKLFLQTFTQNLVLGFFGLKKIFRDFKGTLMEI